MKCWAMRTSRNSEEDRDFLRKELLDGRLRQGWGYDESQNLDDIKRLWSDPNQITDCQNETQRHWRMGNGDGDAYMQVGDLVVVPNMPHDGVFTICRVVGNYYFDIATERGDFGHVRPVETLTPPIGVSNNHEFVVAGLRRSFRCQSRMWNVNPYRDCLIKIQNSNWSDLTGDIKPEDRVEFAVVDAITEPLHQMAERLGPVLQEYVQAEEWEKVLRSALEQLFPVSVEHTGGPGERGADLDIVIPNPFDEDRDWIIPVQVKDHSGTEGVKVASQLETAFKSRSDRGQQVIAVVLMVSNATASDELKERMGELRKKHGVPFIYCGRDQFLRLIARGFLRRS